MNNKYAPDNTPIGFKVRTTLTMRFQCKKLTSLCYKILNDVFNGRRHNYLSACKICDLSTMVMLTTTVSPCGRRTCVSWLCRPERERLGQNSLNENFETVIGTEMFLCLTAT